MVGAVYDLREVAVSEDSMSHDGGNAFERIAIWLESPRVITTATTAATLQQKGKHFEPDLTVIPTGSTINFPNADPVFHNIFSLSRTQSFDLGYYSGGHSRSVTFPRAGIVQVYCHLHPQMHAVIIVASTPWAGKPRPDGTFSWTNVPPGIYKLNVWQKSVGLLHKTIVVPEAGSVHSDISLPNEDLER